MTEPRSPLGRAVRVLEGLTFAFVLGLAGVLVYGIWQGATSSIQADLSLCRGDHARCVVAAERYEKGLGVEPDLARAIELYQLATIDGSKAACERLVELHRAGALALDAIDGDCSASPGGPEPLPVPAGSTVP